MIPLPESIKLKRNTSAEALLVRKARDWIETDDRAPGIHASDLLDERQAFFQHTDPRPLSDRLVSTFLVGKVLHAFVINAVDGVGSEDISASDTGSDYSNDLDITFSPDVVLRGIVRELKTSRSFYEPKSVEDLRLYIEQLLVYMVAKGHTRSQLWILFLNFKDEERRTAPAFRAYDVVISEEDLAKLKEYLAERVQILKAAIAAGSYAGLPLCREWKCGAKNCQWYEKCKPEGRYGDPRFDSVSEAPKSTRAKKAR